MRKFLLLFALVLINIYLSKVVAQNSNSALLIRGQTNLIYDSERLTQFTATGDAMFNDVLLEVELTATVRATDLALLEQSKLAGLEGVCKVYSYGDPVGEIIMRSGRMNVSIVDGLLDRTLDEATEGKADSPVVNFSKDSDKAEWVEYINIDGERFAITVRFVHREATGRLMYYVIIGNG